MMKVSHTTSAFDVLTSNTLARTYRTTIEYRFIDVEKLLRPYTAITHLVTSQSALESGKRGEGLGICSPTVVRIRAKPGFWFIPS